MYILMIVSISMASYLLIFIFVCKFRKPKLFIKIILDPQNKLFLKIMSFSFNHVKYSVKYKHFKLTAVKIAVIVEAYNDSGCENDIILKRKV